MFKRRQGEIQPVNDLFNLFFICGRSCHLNHSELPGLRLTLSRISLERLFSFMHTRVDSFHETQCVKSASHKRNKCLMDEFWWLEVAYLSDFRTSTPDGNRVLTESRSGRSADSQDCQRTLRTFTFSKAKAKVVGPRPKQALEWNGKKPGQGWSQLNKRFRILGSTPAPGEDALHLVCPRFALLSPRIS